MEYCEYPFPIIVSSPRPQTPALAPLNLHWHPSIFQPFRNLEGSTFQPFYVRDLSSILGRLFRPTSFPWIPRIYVNRHQREPIQCSPTIRSFSVCIHCSHPRVACNRAWIWTIPVEVTGSASPHRCRGPVDPRCSSTYKGINSNLNPVHKLTNSGKSQTMKCKA